MAEKKDDNKPTIIIKKGGHGGHHGGAWKIAYADFTTAMMCFFLCMWLINSTSVTVRAAIASYFRKPSIFQEGAGQPLLLGGAGILEDAYTPPREKETRRLKDPTEDQKTFGEKEKDLDKLYIQEGTIEPIKHKGPTKVTGLNSPMKSAEETKKDVKLRLIAEETRQQIDKILNSSPNISQVPGAIDTKVETDGLKIEIMDTEKYSMFESGSARIRPEAEGAFKQIVDVIRRYPNSLEIFGHTDSQPFPSKTGGYTNWELSADRANSARRLIESQGYPASRIIGVTGKANSEPRRPQNPLDPSNRRITLKLRFTTKTEFLREKGPEGGYNDPLKELLRSESSKTPAPSETAAATGSPQAQGGAAAPVAADGKAAVPEAVASAAPPNTMNPDYMPRDKIFEGNPSVSPGDLTF
jgi:chemotaxis protein MotB